MHCISLSPLPIGYSPAMKGPEIPLSSSPRQSSKAFDVSNTNISLTDACMNNKSSVPVPAEKTTDATADYSIFHQPAADAFEPIPFGKRTRQQEAAINEMMQESLRYLFDTHNVSSLCRSPLSDQTPWDSDSSHDDSDSDAKEQERRPKRQRLSIDEYSTLRFRGYQTEAWEQRLEDLLSFREKEGHCSVPHSYRENPALARWVKRQRYQYKLRAERKTSTMTSSRVKILEDIGFVWDSHLAVWEERLSDLRKYRAQNGNCEVPTHYQANKKLATWVKCQRRQYKLYLAGRPSTMNAERVDILNKLGFSWDMRSSKNNSSTAL
ncbi:unnamed protein product [Cylindrotheca closterium]|uniref:Helicase-associated domain-containing protein n=1 Tax=Cylindrotheca closterium TaxID=2856 RepID=A0AAD2FX91_9STRA|nr:unnamed protein product [Cylindrotheca closterium]